MRMRIIPLFLIALVLSTPVRGAVSLVEFGESNLTAAIPDNNSAGLSRSLNVSGYELKAPYVVTVSLKILGTGFGAYNGDYYADLRHLSADGTVTQLAVLLNRLGKSTDLPSGYSDNGINVTFADAADEDIHNYRFALSGGHNNPTTGALTGTWQPDGRTADPFQVLDTSLRTTTLNGLGAGSPNGMWTLFVADNQAGGLGQLIDWKVTLQGVPEPSSASLLIAGTIGLLAVARRRKG